MTRKVAQPPPEQPLLLTLPRNEAASRIIDRIDKGKELKERPINDADALKAVKAAYWTWTEYNEEMLRQMFTTPKMAEEYSGFFGAMAIGGERSLQEDVRELHGWIDDRIRTLSSIRERLELVQLAPGVSGPALPLTGQARAQSCKV